MKLLAFIAALTLAACGSAPSPHMSSSDGRDDRARTVRPALPKRCTNCGINQNPPPVKVYDHSLHL